MEVNVQHCPASMPSVPVGQGAGWTNKADVDLWYMRKPPLALI